MAKKLETEVAIERQSHVNINKTKAESVEILRDISEESDYSSNPQRKRQVKFKGVDASAIS